jgi:hypothetical protein
MPSSGNPLDAHVEEDDYVEVGGCRGFGSRLGERQCQGLYRAERRESGRCHAAVSAAAHVCWCV